MDLSLNADILDACAVFQELVVVTLDSFGRVNLISCNDEITDMT